MKFAIRNARFRIGKLKAEIRTRWESLVSIMESQDICFVNDFVKGKMVDHDYKTRSIVKKQLNTLGIVEAEEAQEEMRDLGVVNWSSRTLTKHEISVLAMGPDFIPTLKISDIEVRCDVEAMLKTVPGESFNDIILYDKVAQIVRDLASALS
ncbi:hypothetical protein ACOME3_008851 [Neoechinorhynchus agilis]